MTTLFNNINTQDLGHPMSTVQKKNNNNLSLKGHMSQLTPKRVSTHPSMVGVSHKYLNDIYAKCTWDEAL